MESPGAAEPMMDGVAPQPGIAAEQVEVEEEAGEAYDPYAPLDMYDAGTHKAKPFRRLRIRAKPTAPSGADAGSSGATGNSLFPVPDAPVSGVTFPEFAYALEAIRYVTTHPPTLVGPPGE